LFFNLTLDCTIISKVQENKEVLELNGACSLLVYSDDDKDKVLGENITIIKENTGVLLDASKEAGLEEGNAEKIEYMFMSHHQTTGQNHYMQVADSLFKCGIL
jgi:hypothetical protein